MVLLLGMLVSIPHWYDYNAKRSISFIAGDIVSIPHWYDYNVLFRLPQVNLSTFQFHTGTIITSDVRFGHPG